MSGLLTSCCQDGKNKLFLICDHCKCKVMRPGYGRLTEKEVRADVVSMTKIHL